MVPEAYNIELLVAVLGFGFLPGKMMIKNDIRNSVINSMLSTGNFTIENVPPCHPNFSANLH